MRSTQLRQAALLVVCGACSKHVYCVRLQADPAILYRTQAEQLQLLNRVINSKETLEKLLEECGKDRDEAGVC